MIAGPGLVPQTGITKDVFADIGFVGNGNGVFATETTRALDRIRAGGTKDTTRCHHPRLECESMKSRVNMASHFFKGDKNGSKYQFERFERFLHQPSSMSVQDIEPWMHLCCCCG